MINKIKKNIFLGIGFAAVIYFILIVYNDHTKIYTSITNFPAGYLILAQFIIFLSLWVKFIRWNYFLKLLKIELHRRDSILIFASGLMMSITPGKVGELLKSFLIKKKYNYSISLSSSAVIAERIVEFITLVILGSIGIIIYNQAFEYVLIALIILSLFLIIFINHRVQSIFYKFIQKISYLEKYIENLETFSSSLKSLFDRKYFSKSLALSLFAWVLECLAFYLILIGFSSDYSIEWSFFIYLFSLFIGSITMLPGGIGATEGSLVYLLSQNGFLENQAISVTLIIRIITLWVPVLLGFGSIMYFLKKIKGGTA